MKWLLACLVMVCLCIPVFAEETGSTDWDYINGTGFDTLLGHNHQYTCPAYAEDEKEPELGIGVDVTVYEFEGVVNAWGMDSIEVQNKYDLNAGNYEGYIVAKANLWRPIKKLFGGK